MFQIYVQLTDQRVHWYLMVASIDEARVYILDCFPDGDNKSRKIAVRKVVSLHVGPCLLFFELFNFWQNFQYLSCYHDEILLQKNYISLIKSIETFIAKQ